VTCRCHVHSWITLAFVVIVRKFRLPSPVFPLNSARICVNNDCTCLQPEEGTVSGDRSLRCPHDYLFCSVECRTDFHVEFHIDVFPYVDSKRDILDPPEAFHVFIDVVWSHHVNILVYVDIYYEAFPVRSCNSFSPSGTAALWELPGYWFSEWWLIKVDRFVLFEAAEFELCSWHKSPWGILSHWHSFGEGIEGGYSDASTGYPHHSQGGVHTPDVV
jgi:hypothetical protein